MPAIHLPPGAAILTLESLGLAKWIETGAIGGARHAHFVTADIPATRRRILELSQGRCRFTVTDASPFVQFREAHAYAGAFAIKFYSWNCFCRCETQVARGRDHHVSLYIPLAGDFEAQQGNQTVKTRPGQMLVIASPGAVRRWWNHPCDLLNVMVNREVAMRVFSQVPGNLALDTMPMTLIDLSDAASLATFIEVLVRDLGRRRPAFSTESALPHVERLLLTLLAEAIRGARGLLDDRERTTAAPYYVVRAEDYLRRHYTGKIRMGDVARACGVSLRTLHYGFKRFRDRGPAELLREIRLTQARQGLIEARLTGLRVAEIAASSGFPNASQFTRDYRAHFGESPSATLRAAFD